MKRDARVERIAEICLALPETTREDVGLNTTFRVRRKPFAYFLNNHHGDGIIRLWCKVLPGDNHALIRSGPQRFYMPAYVGPRGWVGLRLDVGEVDWDEVSEVLRHSYLLIAPKSLSAKVSGGAAGG
jgi:predicted DNA-binding protein (MmcQ/YjbR family)